MLFNRANMPYWILLGMGVLLFLFVIISGAGDDDIDIDTDVDVDSDFNISGFALSWMGIGKAPLILLLATDLSLWGLFGWMFNVWLGEILDRVPSDNLSLVVIIMSLVVS